MASSFRRKNKIGFLNVKIFCFELINDFYEVSCSAAIELCCVAPLYVLILYSAIELRS